VADELVRLHQEIEATDRQVEILTDELTKCSKAYGGLQTENEALRIALQVMLRDYTAVHDIGDVEMQPAIYQAREALAQGEKT
jgi:predicted  nucleic acid-binding Zn-ribbon protein